MTTECDAFAKAKERFSTTAIALKVFWLRYRRNQGATFGLIVIAILIVTAVFADVISPYSPTEMHLTPEWILRGPSIDHFFGTDDFGRDVFSRIIWGARPSLFVGFAAAAIAAVIGIFSGSIAGYYGGIIDELIMRVVDIWLSLPDFFLILLVVALFGRNIWIVVAVIGFMSWPSTARLIRAETLSVKNRYYVMAAKSVGASDAHILFSEILPNVIQPVIVNTALSVGWAILTESSLTFLGLGDPNTPSWGWMLNGALGTFMRAWWTGVFPGIAISLTVVSFNLIGDGLSDVLNPRSRRS